MIFTKDKFVLLAIQLMLTVSISVVFIFFHYEFMRLMDSTIAQFITDYPSERRYTNAMRGHFIILVIALIILRNIKPLNIRIFAIACLTIHFPFVFLFSSILFLNSMNSDAPEFKNNMLQYLTEKHCPSVTDNQICGEAFSLFLYNEVLRGLPLVILSPIFIWFMAYKLLPQLEGQVIGLIMPKTHQTISNSSGRNT